MESEIGALVAMCCGLFAIAVTALLLYLTQRDKLRESGMMVESLREELEAMREQKSAAGQSRSFRPASMDASAMLLPSAKRARHTDPTEIRVQPMPEQQPFQWPTPPPLPVQAAHTPALLAPSATPGAHQRTPQPAAEQSPRTRPPPTLGPGLGSTHSRTPPSFRGAASPTHRQVLFTVSSTCPLIEKDAG
eukprot:TRINITY_DN17304_c0_g1_i1.p1 TRINITY_DN17304_c0_g1~~TRINITY_DN17304_c0_g1_i1.p1  ORF type:complete len:211 (+),score=67.03 TRINITY_DN17304_c0_g1_i1:63-635(+)